MILNEKGIHRHGHSTIRDVFRQFDRIDRRERQSKWIGVLESDYTQAADGLPPDLMWYLTNPLYVDTEAFAEIVERSSWPKRRICLFAKVTAKGNFIGVVKPMFFDEQNGKYTKAEEWDFPHGFYEKLGFMGRDTNEFMYMRGYADATMFFDQTVDGIEETFGQLAIRTIDSAFWLQVSRLADIFDVHVASWIELKRAPAAREYERGRIESFDIVKYRERRVSQMLGFLEGMEQAYGYSAERIWAEAKNSSTYEATLARKLRKAGGDASRSLTDGAFRNCIDTIRTVMAWGIWTPKVSSHAAEVQ